MVRFLCAVLFFATTTTGLGAEYEDRIGVGDSLWIPGGANGVPILENHPANTTTVCRYRSPDGYCYRLRLYDPSKKSHMHIPINNKRAFGTLLAKLDTLSTGSYCKIMPAQWTAWKPSGAISAELSARGSGESRSCTVPEGGCPDACPAPTESREAKRDDPSGFVRPSCRTARNADQHDQALSDTSDCGDRVTNSGNLETCDSSDWTPSAATQRCDVIITQVNKCGAVRTVAGEKLGTLWSTTGTRTELRAVNSSGTEPSEYTNVENVTHLHQINECGVERLIPWGY